MRWHDVLWTLARKCRGDATLVGIYGQKIYQAGEVAWAVPSLEYRIVSDTANENWEPCTVQFDQWTKRQGDLVISEHRLRAMFDQPIPITLDVGGSEPLITWTVFDGGAELTGPENLDYFGRAIRFHCTPLRGDHLDFGA